jgi:hypothetical protein
MKVLRDIKLDAGLRTEGGFSRIALLKRGPGNDELKIGSVTHNEDAEFQKQSRKLAYYKLQKNKFWRNYSCLE